MFQNAVVITNKLSLYVSIINAIKIQFSSVESTIVSVETSIKNVTHSHILKY